jgi:signal transduction histidine kinase
MRIAQRRLKVAPGSPASDAARPEPHDWYLPVSSRAYFAYVNFWHAVTLLVYAALGARVVWLGCDGPPWQTLLALGLVLIQAGTYIRLYVFVKDWPLPLWQHAIYFGVGLTAWGVHVQLFPQVANYVLMFLGQALGLLTPLPATVVVATVVCALLVHSAGWDVRRIPASALIPAAGTVAGIAVTHLFIYHATRASAERGRLIAQLEQAQRALEQARARDMELAALRERERIARDMHDELGHTLVALSVQLEALQRLLKVDPERAWLQIEAMKQQTRESMAALRRTLAGLRAPQLGGQALSQALRQCCAALAERAGLSVVCRVDDGVDHLSPALAEVVWAVAQEMLANVERHAKARHVTLECLAQPDGLCLRVSDDGVGCDPQALERPGHYGMRGMRERVTGVGGALRVQAAPGAGMTVEATFPLVHAGAAATSPGP